MTMSGDDVSTSVVQRFEVFTGAGKRREWPAEVKASIVAESFSGQEAVSSVARRHAIAPNQLFAWRRDLRKEFEARGVALSSAPPRPSFVPAVVDPLPASDVTPASRRRRKRRRLNAGAVELEIDGVSVTIGRGADAEVIGVVIEALRARR
jgi:transposase